jgi:hypothetical protein
MMTLHKDPTAPTWDPDRREFVQAAMGVATAASFPGTASASDRDAIPRRPLGKTGARVSALGIGGYHIGQAASKEVAGRIVHGVGVTIVGGKFRRLTLGPPTEEKSHVEGL